MRPQLIADIGGTNARFALVKGKDASGFIIDNVKILPGADYESFEAAINAYLATLDCDKPSEGCIAIAGPVSGDLFKMTNLPWSFSRSELQAHLGFTRLGVINDYTALALATTQLRAEHLIELKPGESVPKGNRAIFGPGTGLGVAGITATANEWVPIPSEGGHVNLAPTNEYEAKVIAVGIKKFGHLSAELFLSGPGLVNLYQCICELEGEVAEAYQPQDVTRHALAASDALCVKTLTTFCNLIGAFAGNLALTYGAKGGVFITGGIMPRVVEFAKHTDLVKNFSSKGVMSHYLSPIAISLVNFTESAFLGTATWLDQ